MKWRKEMCDWCFSEKFRFAARLYEHKDIPEAIPPSDSPWAVAAEHTMATNTQCRGLVPHSRSNELCDDSQQAIIQANSSLHSGNLWLPCKDSDLPQFPSPSDSTVLYNGVTMMEDSSTMHAKGSLPGENTRNLQNPSMFPNPTERNVWGNGAARIVISTPMPDSFYDGSTSVRDGIIWLSDENSSVSQKYTQFSSPGSSEGLCNSYSSVTRDACRLDSGTIQSCAKANILQNSTQFPSLNKTEILDKTSSSRSKMGDAGAMHTNTWLSFRRGSFFQDCTHFPNPTENKNMNSGDKTMRDSSTNSNINLKGDAGGINGTTCVTRRQCSPLSELCPVTSPY